MIYCTQHPAAPLSSFVEWLWYFEGLEVPHHRERVLPDGSMELVINLDDSRRKLFDRDHPDRFQCFHRSWVSGARSDYILIDVLPRSSMIGVHFKPGGLAPFVETPPGSLAGDVVELDALLGHDAGNLRDALLEARGARAKFRILERFLLERFRPDDGPDPAVQYALREFQRNDSAIGIRQVAESAGWSHKHFIERFRRDVGLTPKRFCRVRRFQRILASIQAGRRVDWSAVAAGAGYFDQSHLAHDFKAFSGWTPSDYLARYKGEANFVPADG